MQFFFSSVNSFTAAYLYHSDSLQIKMWKKRSMWGEMQCKDVSFASSAKKYSWQEMCYAVSGNTEEKTAIFQAQDKNARKLSCCLVWTANPDE